jgi:nucleoside 2-deoxyribosyltransferase
MDLKLLSKADVLVRLPGLSIGADKEVGYATSVGIPVFHTIEDALKYCDATELCGHLGIDKPMV